MVSINKLLKDKTPFAVMQYFEWLKSAKSQTNKVYELIYLTSKKKLGYRLLNENEIFFVKTHPNIFELAHDTNNGRIYEYNDFKKYKEENMIVEVPTLVFRKNEMETFIKGIEDEEIRKHIHDTVFLSNKPKERSEAFINCLKEFKMVYEPKPKKNNEDE